ncbi:MAG TPA: DUF6263 family protein, partial [Candidatus Paceibacterota bacterium]|nr:DUF6263 family protein [Candidatus Paceibacterota bacterium]
DPNVMPQVAEAMKKALGGVKGLAYSGVVSSRGISKSVEVNLPADMDPQMRQQMEQMKEIMGNSIIPLPAEAVGPGAKWEVKMPIKSQGMTLNQTMTYQLVSVDAGQLSIATTVSQAAANQKIQNPTMPALKVDLIKMTGTGTGNSSYSLTKLMPVKSSANAHIDMTMGMNIGAQKQAMNMKMDMDIQIESK